MTSYSTAYKKRHQAAGMTELKVMVPRELFGRLPQARVLLGRTNASIVREALEEYLGRNLHGPEAPSRTGAAEGMML